MAQTQPMQTELGETCVRGTMSLPEEKKYEPPYAALLLCSEPACPPIDDAFEDDCIAAVNAAGIAVIRRVRTDEGLSDSIDVAAATWHWMALNDSLDHQRFGIIGIGCGALAGLGLAQRTETIQAVCLLNPRLSPDETDDADATGSRPPSVETNKVKLHDADVHIIQLPRRMLRSTDLTHGNIADIRERSKSLERITIPDDGVTDVTSLTRRAVISEVASVMQQILQTT